MTDNGSTATPWWRPTLRWLRSLAAEPRHYLEHGIPPGEHLRLRTRIALGGYLLYRALWDSDLTTRAASLSYTLVFALIPLLTTSLAFFSAFAGEQYQKKFQSMLLNYLLPGAVADVQQYIDQFTERAAAMGTVSSLVFFATILLLFRSLEDTFNHIWRSETSRTWAERLQVLALFFIVGALAATAMITLESEALRLAEEVANMDLGGFQPTLSSLGLEALGLLTAWAFFVLVNKVLPKARVKWIPAIAGGVFAGTVWQVLKTGFTWYVQDVASYGHIYGAVGTVPVFLLWLYLSLLLMLLGANTAFVTQHFRALVAWQRLEAQTGDQPAYYAVATSAQLARAFLDRNGPMTLRAIAEALHIDPFYIAEALKPLLRSQVIQKISVQGRPARYLLSVPPDALSVGEVVRIATGENLEVPPAPVSTPLHDRVRTLFAEATSQENSVLERADIATLAEEVPSMSATRTHPNPESERGSPATTGQPRAPSLPEAAPDSRDRR